MAELSFASMKTTCLKIIGRMMANVGYDNNVVAKIIINANSNNTILQYGKMIGNMNKAGDEKEALEFGERAIKNRIPFVMIALSLTHSNQALDACTLRVFKYRNFQMD